MPHWKRSDVQELLSDLDAEVVESEPGGDWDIKALGFAPLSIENRGEDRDAWVWITPFKDPNEDSNYAVQDDCEIYALEIRTNGDSRGGCQATNEDVAVLYARITAKLREQGWHIIGHYDEIF